ncbi:transcription/translation regulatory transformer protein RfaH [Ferrimonas gelatinilytica]|uniref:Transcription antitermination protein RfaH n=2 Tax=Ferrimonas gelatinilytica TaxID=1255257 RepID=A0ABP9RV04_9GAMM
MQSWYLLYCKGKQEKRAQAALENQHLATFLPEINVERLKRGKRVMEAQPLFPNYLFVRFDPCITPIQAIRSTPGVSSIVRTQGQLLPVETSLVVGLRQMQAREQESKEPLTESSLPKSGEKVTITDGPFASLCAIYAEPDGARRSVLLLEMMGKTQRVSLDNLSFTRR